MACEPIILNDITPKLFDDIKGKLSSFGVNLPEGPRGSVDKMGFKANFEWEEATATLTITILDKPFYITCSMIEERIRARM